MDNYYSEMTELGLQFHSFMIKAIKGAIKDYQRDNENPGIDIIYPSEEEFEHFEAKVAESSFSDFIRNRDLKEIVESLPHDLREIIELYYFHGYSNKNIAELLGVSEVTLIKKKKEAIKIIRENLTSA